MCSDIYTIVTNHKLVQKGPLCLLGPMLVNGFLLQKMITSQQKPWKEGGLSYLQTLILKKCQITLVLNTLSRIRLILMA